MNGTFLVLSLQDMNPINWKINPMEWNLNPINWEIVKNLNESLKTIAKVCEYLLHPTRILIAFWNFTWEISFVVCLFISMASLILYLTGHKKFAKWIPTSLITYTLIQIVGRI